MQLIRSLVERAAHIGVAPSMVLKSELGLEVLKVLAPVDGIVLQGGGALHHVYGSPRFSADLDFVQKPSLDEACLEGALGSVKAVVEASWGPCGIEPCKSKGRLHRQKIRVDVSPGTSLVLAIERYEVAVHTEKRRALVGDPASSVAVEAPAEIVADKLAASADRLRARGAIKLRDLYDIWFLLRLERPDPPLVDQKLQDYGIAGGRSTLAEVARSLDALALAGLSEQLRGVLPDRDLSSLDARALVGEVRTLLEEASR